MVSYTLKRLLLAIPTLIGILLVTFLLLRAIPGNPAHILVGERSTPEVIEAYEKKLGLNLPFAAQFGKYLLTTVQGDLGVSYFTGQSVSKTLLQKFPNTLRLAFWALFFALVLGTFTGMLAAAFKHTRLDKVLLFISLLGLSIPVFLGWDPFDFGLCHLFATPPTVGNGEWALELFDFACGYFRSSQCGGNVPFGSNLFY